METYSIQEMNAAEIRTAQAVVESCREVLIEAARQFSARYGIPVLDVAKHPAFRDAAIQMLEGAAGHFSEGHGCRRGPLRAAIVAAMKGAI